MCYCFFLRGGVRASGSHHPQAAFDSLYFFFSFFSRWKWRPSESFFSPTPRGATGGIPSWLSTRIRTLLKRTPPQPGLPDHDLGGEKRIRFEFQFRICVTPPRRPAWGRRALWWGGRGWSSPPSTRTTTARSSGSGRRRADRSKRTWRFFFGISRLSILHFFV